MALRLSKKMCELMAGGKAVVNEAVQATLSFNNGTPDTITAASGLDVFHPGDKLAIVGTVNNDTIIDGSSVTVVSVTATTITLKESGSLTTEAAVANAVIMTARGHSVSDLYRNGVLRIYSGAQAATPESAAPSGLLLEISVSSGAYGGPSTDANGLLFDVTSQLDVSGQAAGGQVAKDANQVWSDAGISGSTPANAQSFRFYQNATADQTGADASEQYVRMDGAVAQSGSDMNLSNNYIEAGLTTTIDTFNFKVPGNYNNA